MSTIINERFRSTDPRFSNRSILILNFAGVHPKRGQLYRYEVVVNEDLPHTVGRHGRISAQTLNREYERISK